MKIGKELIVIAFTIGIATFLMLLDPSATAQVAENTGVTMNMSFAGFALPLIIVGVSAFMLVRSNLKE